MGSIQLINTYWDKLGGKPSITAPNKGPGRKRNISSTASEDTTTKKRHRGESEEKKPVQRKSSAEASTWKPPADMESWDDKVAHVETVERTDDGLLLVYLQWYLNIFSFNGVNPATGKMDASHATILPLSIKSVHSE